MVERGDFCGPDLIQRHRPECRKNLTVVGHLVGLGRRPLAPDAEFERHTACRWICDLGLGSGFGGTRALPPLTHA